LILKRRRGRGRKREVEKEVIMRMTKNDYRNASSSRMSTEDFLETLKNKTPLSQEVIAVLKLVWNQHVPSPCSIILHYLEDIT